jgi:3-oxoacyl-[acyl-carrier protein] reductase
VTSAFQDQVALVTGASGGIGGETARRLAAGGAKVALQYKSNPAGAEAILAAITAAGGTAITVQGDASNAADAARVVAETVATFGKLTLLVNGAGLSTPSAFGEMTEDAIDREFAANVRSVVLMTQAAAPHLENGGRVVNISSNLAFGPMPGLTLYCAAKAAVASLTQGFARELGSKGITVNAVAPGATVTPMTDWLDRSVMDGIGAATPLGRVAMPDDVADAILFLASPDSRWVNGRTLIVDGGLI